MSDTLAVPLQPTAKSAGSSQRLLSLDALRGFDMFWIVGGDELIHAFAKAIPIYPLELIDGQMDHKSWQGVAFYDLIFPLFVFIVGVSLVFSLSSAIARDGKAAALKRILIRSLIIYVFGLIVYGGLSKGIDHIRWMGVLQRIAICYFFGSILFCTFRMRGLITICISLLIGYWALTTFVPIRDFNIETRHLAALQLTPTNSETMVRFKATTTVVSGKFDDGLNLPQHVDFQYLPGYKWDGAYDPEGILSTFPAIATCLLGIFAGLLLKNGNVPAQKKVAFLAASGAVGVILGFLWGMEFPVIKKLWTSSYVLVAGGYSALFLAAFYQMIEIWEWRKWCTPFVWIGMNAITIYMAFHLIKFEDYAQRITGGPVQASLGPWGMLLTSIVVIVMMFAFVRFLYNRKIFLRL
jgi:predicted acyltransferase